MKESAEFLYVALTTGCRSESPEYKGIIFKNLLYDIQLHLYTGYTIYFSGEKFIGCIPYNPERMPLTVFNIVISGDCLNRAGQRIRTPVYEVPVFINTDMVEPGIIKIKILPCVNRDSDGGGNILESDALSVTADTGADRLKNKYNSVSPKSVFASQENIKNVIEGLGEIDLVFIP